MEKAKHTPGPWTLGEIRNASGVVKGGPARELHTGSTVQGQVALASLQEWMGPGEREANAALIAAAPDMLDALNEARDYLGSLTDGGPVLLGLVCVIDDAIAKAEGGAA